MQDIEAVVFAVDSSFEVCVGGLCVCGLCVCVCVCVCVYIHIYMYIHHLYIYIYGRMLTYAIYILTYADVCCVGARVVYILTYADVCYIHSDVC